MLRKRKAPGWKWRYHVYLIAITIAVFIIRSFINDRREELHLIPISRFPTRNQFAEDFVGKNFVCLTSSRNYFLRV